MSAPRDERRVVAALVREPELGLLERADPHQQLELVPQVGLHHLGPVGRDRERHTVLDEGPERLPYLGLIPERLRQEVRRRADLERDVRRADRLHQRRIVRSEDAVAEPVGPQRLDHLADLLHAVLAALLADMDRHAEAGVPGELDVLADLRVVVASSSGPRAGDVDADDAARHVLDRLLDDHHVLLGGERAIHHQDQARPDLRVLERREVETADRGEDDVVEVALAAPVALHRVEREARAS